MPKMRDSTWCDDSTVSLPKSGNAFRPARMREIKKATGTMMSKGSDKLRERL